MIVIVDDDRYTRQLISAALMEGGYEVREASTAVEAITLVSEVAPSLLIADLAMPGMDGLDCVKALRANPATAQVPVLLVTGYAYDGDVYRRAQSVGVTHILAKPVDPDLLRSTVRQLVTEAV